jgi:hypothetical protein
MMKRQVCLLLLALTILSAPAVAMPLNLRDLADILPEWPMTTSEAGGLLFLSDSPEEFFSEGILYQDKVKGSARLFFHHVNRMTTKKRVAILLRNLGSAPAQVDVTRYGVSRPDTDYLRAGRAIQAEYFKESPSFKLEIAPKAYALLQAKGPTPVVVPAEIMTGMIDFTASQEVQLTVAAISEQGDPVALLNQLLILPPGDPHLRGTFSRTDRLMLAKNPYNPSSDGPVSITLSDGEIDPFMTGRDATNRLIVKNEGNYGVVYRILLPTIGKGKVRCYFNPRGGIYSGWLRVKAKAEGKMVGAPAHSGGFGHETLADFALLAEFPAGESLWVTFSPAGASNLPVRLILTPAN